MKSNPPVLERASETSAPVDDEDFVSHDEREDFGAPVGRSFTELLLLSLIDAHPCPSEADLSPTRKQAERLKRLQSARASLFCEKTGRGRPKHSDEPALIWMAEQQLRDEGNVRAKKCGFRVSKTFSGVRSERELANQAAEKYFGETNHDVSERLRTKFSEKRKLADGTIIDMKENWIALAAHDGVPESINEQVLLQIAELISPHGIKMKVCRD